jgi:uncharacterized phage protein (TIGR02218 family)
MSVTSLALCWLVERRDGAGIALTSYDRPLTVSGVRFEPAPGILPASIRCGAGLEAGSSEIAGSISSAAISEADIVAGRWDGAALKLFAVDWEQPSTAVQPLIEGELGQVASSGTRFEAELLGVSAKLERPVCPLTSPECRAELGDPQCRVDMAGRKLRALVTGISGNSVTIDRDVDDRFRFGEIRFLGGAANGERRKILAFAGRELSLRSELAVDIAPATPVELSEGCDKRLESCVARFGNAENFRGEPHLPGNDLLTRYPGA